MSLDMSNSPAYSRSKRKNYSICGEGNQKIGIKIYKNYHLISHVKGVTYKINNGKYRSYT